MFAVSLVSRFMHDPSKSHLGAAKRILRYICGTVSYGLWYFPVTDFKCFGCTDSDWASCMDDRKSTTGYVFSLGSGAVSWSSKKQATTALSSTEDEYVAAASTACQAMWIRRILGDLQQVQDEPVDILCDSKSAISIAKNPAFHGRTKHIEIRYHFLREAVSEGLINLKFCKTEDQPADILTKALGYEKFCKFRQLLGVNDFASSGGVGQ